MTHFIFNRFNHNEVGRRSLVDLISVISAQLAALGHTWEIRDDHIFGDTVANNFVNVLFEGFDASHVELLSRAARKGARILIVATEEPTPEGFNHGIDRVMVERQAIFPEAAACAEGILALVPGTDDWYGRYAPAACIELGYSPALIRVPRSAPDHDFGFFGSNTARRDAIVHRIARRGRVRRVTNFPDAAVRDREMGRARVILQIRAHDAMDLVSSSRLNTSLHLGRPVVAEPHAKSWPWDEVVDFVPTEGQFDDHAFAVSRVWSNVWYSQFDRFKRIMTPERCLGAPLRKIGLTARRRAA